MILAARKDSPADSAKKREEPQQTITPPLSKRTDVKFVRRPATVPAGADFGINNYHHFISVNGVEVRLDTESEIKKMMDAGLVFDDPIPEMNYDLSSSNVEGVSYTQNKLYVLFKNGSLYIYFEVPPEHYQAMIDSQSPGTYLTRNIKDRYSYQRLK